MLREHLIFTGVVLLLRCPGSIAERYIGCYGGAPRNEVFFPSEFNLGNKMTKDKCLEICTLLEYRFAGLKRTHCACGSLYPSYESLSPHSDCKSPCEGNTSEKVCGSSSTSVYDLHGSDAAEKLLPFVGCFGKLVSHLSFPYSMNPQDCFMNCQLNGFKYAGFQGYSSICTCSNTAPRVNRERWISPEQCGTHQQAVYYAVPGHDKRYLGCYKLMDHAWKREAFTFNKTCSDLCRQKGLRYSATKGLGSAGTRDEFQCYCSNDRPSYKLMASETYCLRICDESVLELCSDSDYLRVFDLAVGHRHDPPLKKGWCASEKNEKDKVMEGYEILIVDNTLEKCVGLCFRYGYKIAGVKEGNLCRCANETILKEDGGGDDGDCSTPCPGDVTETCGGTGAIYLFDGIQ